MNASDSLRADGHFGGHGRVLTAVGGLSRRVAVGAAATLPRPGVPDRGTRRGADGAASATAFVSLLIAAAFLTGCRADHAGPAARSDPPRPTGQTDRALDLAIEGDGYFIVKVSDAGYLFTRRGGLSVSGGVLVNEDGYPLYPTVNVAVTAAQLAVTPAGVVRVRAVEGDQLSAGQDAGQIVIARFPNAAGLDHDGQYAMPTAASGEPITGRPGSNGLGRIVTGRLTE